MNVRTVRVACSIPYAQRQKKEITKKNYSNEKREQQKEYIREQLSNK